MTMKKLTTISILGLIGAMAAMAQDGSKNIVDMEATHATSKGTTTDGVDFLYASWSKWPVGTKVVYDVTHKYGEITTKGEGSFMLAELSDESVGIVQDSTMGRRPPKPIVERFSKSPCKSTYSAAIEFASATAEEDLTIDGKTYKCRVFTRNDLMLVKWWFCPDVPGYIVKRVTESQAEDGTTAASTMVLKSIVKGSPATSQSTTTSAPTSSPTK